MLWFWFSLLKFFWFWWESRVFWILLLGVIWGCVIFWFGNSWCFFLFCGFFRWCLGYGFLFIFWWCVRMVYFRIMCWFWWFWCFGKLEREWFCVLCYIYGVCSFDYCMLFLWWCWLGWCCFFLVGSLFGLICVVCFWWKWCICFWIFESWVLFYCRSIILEVVCWWLL